MYKCQECGRKFRTTKAAERASNNGCSGCGGVDIDLDVGTPVKTAAAKPAVNNRTAAELAETTRVIGFSAAAHEAAWWRQWADGMVAKNPGLRREPYCCINGGVVVELKFAGPTWMLDKIEARYGYGPY